MNCLRRLLPALAPDPGGGATRGQWSGTTKRRHRYKIVDVVKLDLIRQGPQRLTGELEYPAEVAFVENSERGRIVQRDCVQISRRWGLTHQLQATLEH